MIHLLASLWSSLTDQPETSILILGRSNSGKTALFERLKQLLDKPEPELKQRQQQQEEEEEESNETGGGLGDLRAQLERERREREEQQQQQQQRQAEEQDETAARNEPRPHILTTKFVEDKRRENTNSNNSENQLEMYQYQKLPRFMTPTVGLNVGRGQCSVPSHDGGGGSPSFLNAVLWDVGGDPSIRSLWLTYLRQCRGVVFVFDLTASEEEQREAVKMLHALMRRPELQFAPFLVVGTKLDVILDVKFEEQQQQQQQEQEQEEEHTSSSSSSSFNFSSPDDLKRFSEAAALQMMRALRLEELVLESVTKGERIREARLARVRPSAAPASVSESSSFAAAAGGGAVSSEHQQQRGERDDESSGLDDNNNRNNNDNDFVEVDENYLVALDAADAVHSVPHGAVSGIAGHMFRAVAASAVTMEGADLCVDALYWILSVAARSGARESILRSMAQS